MIFKGHYSNSLYVCDQKKDLKQKKAKPIFTKNYIFANSINFFFFMEMLIQQKKVWTKETDGRAADTIHQQC
jgi:hypothetical protein